MSTFEARLKRLEQINDQIKRSDTPLKESLELFEEGIALARSLEEELTQAEQQVEILLRQPDGNHADEPPGSEDLG